MNTSTYRYELKSKLAQTNKLIELDQNTNRGHPSNSIQVCPVTQVKLWRRVQGRRKRGWGEARGVKTEED